MAERIRAATRPAMVQAAPGVYVKHPEASAAIQTTLADFVEDAPGRFRLVARMDRMVAADAAVMDLIGMSGRMRTLQRLATAGLIEMIPAAPRTFLLNLDSWFNWLRFCAEHPEEVWAHGSKWLKEYRKAIR